MVLAASFDLITVCAGLSWKVDSGIVWPSVTLLQTYRDLTKYDQKMLMLLLSARSLNDLVLACVSNLEI